MWLQAEYQPASLFTLKLSLATSSGARSLVVPTPFAIKTALVDALLRTEPEASATELTQALVGRTLAIRPCRRATITNLFARVLKPRREDAGPARASPAEQTEQPETNPAVPARGRARAVSDLQQVGTTDEQIEAGPEAGPFGRTIAYREYVHLVGALGIAIEVDDARLAERFASLLQQINYFGRRGSFFQLEDCPTLAADLPDGFVPVGVPQSSFLADGLIQVLDDWGPEMTFKKLDIYSPARIRLGRERILHSTILAYRRKQSSRSFTEYELV